MLEMGTFCTITIVVLALVTIFFNGRCKPIFGAHDILRNLGQVREF